MPGTLQQLAIEVMQRELARDPEQFQTRPGLDLGLSSGESVRPVSPGAVGLLGGLADTASTYAFLKRGTRSETNPMLASIGQQRPGMTAALMAGQTVGAHMLGKALRKVSPAVADALQANMGAEQLALAAHNVTDRHGWSFDIYKDAMRRSAGRGGR